MVDTRFHSYRGPIPLGELFAAIECSDLLDAKTDNGIEIAGAEELGTAQSGHIVLAANRKYADALRTTRASVAIIGNALRDVVPDGVVAIIAKDPHGLFNDILDYLYPQSVRHMAQKSASVSQDEEPKLESGVIIGANAVIGAGAEIGADCIIGPNAFVGPGVAIGRGSIIGANATVEYAFLGNNVVVNAGARIGTEGFGWLDQGRTNRKIQQLGRVIIQDSVEIGANSTIDRGALGDTVIGEGTKIDNLVQVGHNCKIGRYCLIAATSGMSGTTELGDGVLVGGGVGTSGHLKVGAGSIIHGRAAVTKDWPAGSKLAGAPAQDIKEFWRETAALRSLTKGDNK